MNNLFPNSKVFSLYLVSIALLSLAVMVGCGSSAGGSYPADGPRYLDGGEGDFPLSLNELVVQSDLIAVVRPTGASREVWNQLGTFVSSRFTAEAVTVFKGEVAPGQKIELYAPGGRVRDPFEATSSRRPELGATSSLEEFVDWPFFSKDRTELVFLKFVSPDPALEKPFYYNLGPSARYSLSDGKLASIYPAGVEVDDPGDVRASLAGTSLEDLRSVIRAQR